MRHEMPKQLCEPKSQAYVSMRTYAPSAFGATLYVTELGGCARHLDGWTDSLIDG